MDFTFPDDLVALRRRFVDLEDACRAEAAPAALNGLRAELTEVAVRLQQHD